jgi:hypothetical protein
MGERTFWFWLRFARRHREGPELAMFAVSFRSKAVRPSRLETLWVNEAP